MRSSTQVKQERHFPEAHISNAIHICVSLMCKYSRAVLTVICSRASEEGR